MDFSLIINMTFTHALTFISLVITYSTTSTHTFVGNNLGRTDKFKWGRGETEGGGQMLIKDLAFL